MHLSQVAVWEHENITNPRIEIDADGRRTVRDAGDYIKTNREWLLTHEVVGYPLADLIQSDGVLHLDTEGEELRRLRRENAELKRANEILKAASLNSTDQCNNAASLSAGVS
jgi:hypothetical protein